MSINRRRIASSRRSSNVLPLAGGQQRTQGQFVEDRCGRDSGTMGGRMFAIGDTVDLTLVEQEPEEHPQRAWWRGDPQVEALTSATEWAMNASTCSRWTPAAVVGIPAAVRNSINCRALSRYL